MTEATDIQNLVDGINDAFDGMTARLATEADNLDYAVSVAAVLTYNRADDELAGIGHIIAGYSDGVPFVAAEVVYPNDPEASGTVYEEEVPSGALAAFYTRLVDAEVALRDAVAAHAA